MEETSHAKKQEKEMLVLEVEQTKAWISQEQSIYEKMEQEKKQVIIFIKLV